MLIAFLQRFVYLCNNNTRISGIHLQLKAMIYEDT